MESIRRKVTEALWRGRWGLLIQAGLLVVLVYLATYLIEPRYRSTAKLAITDNLSQGALAQMGMPGYIQSMLPGGFSAMDLHVELIRSEGFRLDLLRQSLLTVEGDSVVMLEKWGQGSETDALEELEKFLQMEKRENAGVLVISVETFDPLVSSSMTNLIAERLIEFDSRIKASAAGAKEDFFMDRSQDLESELCVAEDTLNAFRTRNRLIQHPGTALEESRLARRVVIKEEVLKNIRIQGELAGLQSQSDVPSLFVIQQARPAAEHCWPHRPRIIVVLLFLFVVLRVIGEAVRQAALKTAAGTDGHA